jgi:hypothetical protein
MRAAPDEHLYDMCRKHFRASFATGNTFWQQEKESCHPALAKMALEGATFFAVAARPSSAA